MGMPVKLSDELVASARKEAASTDVSSERLMRLLTRLGQDVEIVVKSKPRRRERGRIRVVEVKRWGAMKVKDISRRDVRNLLEEIADRAPIMANRTLALIRKMFNFGIERDWVEANPCQMIKRLAPERQRDRVLSEDEIRRLWTALDEEHPIMASLFRLRLLTAQASGT